MNTVRFILVIFLLTTGINTTNAQKKEDKTITQVAFEADKIILNKKHAFDYSRIGNTFEIKDLKGDVLIIGSISQVEPGKFTCHIIFLTLGIQFHNEKIVGRNDLVFALCDNNIITREFTLDEAKLKAFIEKHNQLEDHTPQQADD